MINLRLIILRDQHNKEALLKLEKSFIIYNFNTKNYKPAIIFNCKDLVRDATYYILR